MDTTRIRLITTYIIQAGAEALVAACCCVSAENSPAPVLSRQTAAKEGTEKRLGGPGQYIGACFVSIMIRVIMMPIDYSGYKKYAHLIDEAELLTWMNWFKDARAKVGIDQALKDSINEIVVRSKAARRVDYDSQEAMTEGERIMIKIRPMILEAGA